MAVTFAPLLADGTQLLDGTHDITVNDNIAAEFLTTMNLPTTVPGQVPGKSLYQSVLDYQATPAYAAFSQAKKDLWERVRIAVAAACRIESGIIAWR
jgi:hypothetical protein